MKHEILPVVEEVLASQRFILGPEVEAFEAEVADYCGAKHAIGVSSGTDALLVALMALGVGPGDEVVVPPFTFFATAGTVARLGARPVFVDIEPDTFNIDPERLETAITRRTRAVIPVHLFGRVAAMDAVNEVACRHDLPVIEDAAQAIGADSHGRSAGTMGAMGCFSFFPSKNLGGYGDGGLVTTHDAEMAETVRKLRTHGLEGRYRSRLLGGNFRLDALQAAILRVKLRHLEEFTEGRRTAAERYRQLFRDAGLAAEEGAVLPEDDGPVVVPEEPADGRHVYHQFVIRALDRDLLERHLGEAGVASAVYYPVSLHQQEVFAELGYREGDLPVSERAAGEVLALPMFPEITAAQQERVVGEVERFYDGR
ncbi:MAG: DegT/DnrJ/EryC1/StrS family aminotransferase [Thermoanaerobaculia bacterium]|nr:DegT/DnrJ/EryC1/StrS family aminotransferase [Thermoanaerobaculia bacterium]